MGSSAVVMVMAQGDKAKTMTNRWFPDQGGGPLQPANILHEFQFGKGPMDPKGSRYVLPSAFKMDMGEANPPAGRVDQTRIDSLGLKVGQSFGYWFDFGDDWWHQINVEAIEDKAPSGKFPKVTKRVGKSPPQYLEEHE
ncbi:MAG: hypothetical protein JO034_21745 [Singulisphaera sp.]|nr:hypothetical protein [Singulisphaera sp.]